VALVLLGHRLSPIFGGIAYDWRWDDTLYRGSAAYYGAGRLPYPPIVAETLARTLGLDGTQRLLDVGCGPGSLTLLLAPRVAAAVGIDADADMIAAATAAAERAGVTNVEWRHMRAEELAAGMGRFALVTFAQSFHWFDGPKVAATVLGMLERGGACVYVEATTHRGDSSDDVLEHPRPPHGRIDELVREYLGPARRAGRGLREVRGPGEDDVLRAAGFTGPTRIDLDTAQVVTRSADDVVASIFSLSSSTPHLFGADVDRFEADLRALLHRTAPDGRFSERTRSVRLNVWRP
jgi:SAM-dependent methyltransferase